MGVLAILSTGTYAIIGTMCVQSETCYEKYHKKAKILYRWVKGYLDETIGGTERSPRFASLVGGC